MSFAQQSTGNAQNDQQTSQMKDGPAETDFRLIEHDLNDKESHFMI